MKHQHPSDSDRLLAALSYIWVLFVIPFALGHKKPFIYEHAKQGLALFLLELVLSVIIWVPVIGWALGALGWLFVVVSAVIGIAHALSGKSYEIPFIGQYARKESI
jgi:uncharacterized membrane protein